MAKRKRLIDVDDDAETKAASKKAAKQAKLIELRLKRYERAKRLLKKAETRLKRATTRVKKLQKSCDYYAKVVAGQA